jgi:O-acetyl-ADP-ribose deacetylase (regulator of RNase III)
MKAEIRSIVSPRTEAILCPTNGCGILVESAAIEIESIAQETFKKDLREKMYVNFKPTEVGTVFKSEPYKLSRRSVKKIYYGVFSTHPKGLSSLYVVNNIIKKILKLAIKDGIKSIAIPRLEAFKYGIDESTLISFLVNMAMKYDSKITIKFVDLDDVYIGNVKETILENK